VEVKAYDRIKRLLEEKREGKYKKREGGAFSFL
jgi:hypothetical protein